MLFTSLVQGLNVMSTQCDIFYHASLLKSHHKSPTHFTLYCSEEHPQNPLSTVFLVIIPTLLYEPNNSDWSTCPGGILAKLHAVLNTAEIISMWNFTADNLVSGSNCSLTFWAHQSTLAWLDYSVWKVVLLNANQHWYIVFPCTHWI